MLAKLIKHTLSLLLILALSGMSSWGYAQENVVEAGSVAKNDEQANTKQANAALQADPSPEAVEATVAVEQASSKPIVTALADKPSQRTSSGLSLSKMAISLAIVVLIVLALGWIFKKLTLRLPGSKHIKIISTLALGPKERLLVIEMQGKQRVLGVTANSINLLFELENTLPEEKLASDFHTQLQSFLKK
jgi:flagellar protein FliO/FliZ